MDQFAVAGRYTSSDSESHHKGLTGRLCVVGDASLTVGAGIVQELLKEGAVVVCPLRTQAEVDHLLEDCKGLPEEKLFTEVVDIRQEEACAAFLEDVVARHGRKIDHAVSVFGHFWQGGILSEQPLGEFERALTETASAHFVFTKHVAPVLNQSSSGSLIYISNGAGKYVISPETSLFTVASAALYGIILAAQNEYAEAPFRVNEIRLYAMFKRQSDIGSDNFKDFFGHKAYSNRKVGRMAADLCLSSKKNERLVVTTERLDGEALTV